ncbi:MAG: hypothetical protein RQ824_05160 [bacterium]|nr:hypothetical protein [bacterium]
MLRLFTTCLIALLLNASTVYAAKGAAEETPEFKAERGSYSIGDLISLTLELEGSGFQLGAMDEEEIAPFDLTGSDAAYNTKTNITTLTVKGHIFETGELTVPPFTILNRDGSSIKSKELKIVIKPLLKGDEKDIRAMKPQVAVDESGPLWPWLFAALLIVLIIAVILYLKHLKGKKIAEEVAKVVTPPHIEALEEIRRIEAMNLIREGRIKEFYTLVSDAIRVFEGKSHGFDAMEMTTEELSRNIRKKAGTKLNAAEEEKDILIIERFLRDCDMVKFAKYRPADMDISALCERAREIIKGRQIINDKASILEEEVHKDAGQEAAELMLQSERAKGDKNDAV